jgi:hypothetical protein
MSRRNDLLKKMRQYVRRQHRRDFRRFVTEAAELPLWRRLFFCWLLLWGFPSDPREQYSWFASRQMPDTEPPDRSEEDVPDFLTR